jgi:hypothetical protein
VKQANRVSVFNRLNPRQGNHALVFYRLDNSNNVKRTVIPSKSVFDRRPRPELGQEQSDELRSQPQRLFSARFECSKFKLQNFEWRGVSGAE